MVPKCFPHRSMRIQPRDSEGSHRITVCLQLCPVLAKATRERQAGSRMQRKELHEESPEPRPGVAQRL